MSPKKHQATAPHQNRRPATNKSPHTRNSTPRAPESNKTVGLRTEILETALRGREKAVQTQQELDQQQIKLRRSLAKAKSVAKQSQATAKSVKTLIDEAHISRSRQILRACCYTLTCCCLCCCPATRRRQNDEASEGTSDGSEATNSPASDMEDVEDEKMTLDRLERLKEDATRRRRNEQDKPSWKRTLVPLRNVAHNKSADIWYRQVDASLAQLQQVAEETSQSLDEQIKLAQMLTIYLNYGADQVIHANDMLHAEKGIF